MKTNTTTLAAVPVLASLEAPLSRVDQRIAIFAQRTAPIDTHPAALEQSRALAQPCQSNLPARASSARVRNGKIARLPKLHRDMVNRMLFQNIPYAKIVGALGELDIHVTQRNISNWKSRGGYREWRAEQERQLQLSTLQDNLTDYLRKNDASQLPEVGLQVAATQLSLSLLQPEAARELCADPDKYSKVVDMLCRLSTHIQSLQQDRNESAKKAGSRYSIEHQKRREEQEIESVRSSFSSDIGNSPKDRSIPHRNELPPRDSLPCQDPGPEPPGFMEILQAFKSGAPLPGLPSPAPLPKPAPSATAKPRSDV